VLICRRYGVRCAGCSGRIPPTEVVRRAQQYVYHLECFTCTVCGLQLNTGDQFCLMEDDRKLVCKADYLTINSSSQLGALYLVISLSAANDTDVRLHFRPNDDCPYYYNRVRCLTDQQI